MLEVECVIWPTDWTIVKNPRWAAGTTAARRRVGPAARVIEECSIAICWLNNYFVALR